MLWIITERVLAIKEEVCLCIIDCQKAFDRESWKKLLEILENMIGSIEDLSRIRSCM